MSGRQRQLSMGFLAEPSDVNFGGKVHGGQVMRWIDQAGYAAAVGWSGHYSVTVAVGGIRFVAPIRIGDLVALQRYRPDVLEREVARLLLPRKLLFSERVQH